MSMYASQRRSIFPQRKHGTLTALAPALWSLISFMALPLSLSVVLESGEQGEGLGFVVVFVRFARLGDQVSGNPPCLCLRYATRHEPRTPCAAMILVVVR